MIRFFYELQNQHRYIYQVYHILYNVIVKSALSFTMKITTIFQGNRSCPKLRVYKLLPDNTYFPTKPYVVTLSDIYPRRYQLASLIEKVILTNINKHLLGHIKIKHSHDWQSAQRYQIFTHIYTINTYLHTFTLFTHMNTIYTYLHFAH